MKKLATFALYGFFAAICLTTFAVTVSAQKSKSDSTGRIKKRKKKEHQSKNENKVQKQIERTPAQLALFDKLIEQATTNGSVRVIVGVGALFKPEGELLPEAREIQRAGIGSAQDALLFQLKQFQTSNVRKYEFIPYFAITVDAAALEFMKTSPLVTGIYENNVRKPALNQSVPQQVERTPEQLALFDNLIEKAEVNGSVVVIIGLQTASVSDAISAAAQRDTLLAQLAQFQVTNVIKFHFASSFALTANADAIAYLKNSPLVALIQEETADIAT